MKAQENSPQTFWTLTRIGLAGSAILLIAAVTSAIYNSDELPPPQEVNNASVIATPETRPATPAAARELPVSLMEASFALLDGKNQRLSDYSGKVLVVDLWATWCAPCRLEIPHLVKIAKEYKGKGVEVIGLTIEDPESDAEVVKDFSKQFKINYPVGWADIQMRAGLTNGSDGIPQTLIIGRDGKVKQHFVGFNAAVSVSQIKAALDEAVAAE